MNTPAQRVLLGLVFCILVAGPSPLAARLAVAQNKAVQGAILNSVQQQNRMREELRETKQELKAIREGLGIEGETTQTSPPDWTPPDPASVGVVVAGVALVLLGLTGCGNFWLFLAFGAVQIVLSLLVATDTRRPETQAVGWAYVAMLCGVLPSGAAVRDHGTERLTLSSFVTGPRVLLSWLTILVTTAPFVAWNAMTVQPQSAMKYVWYSLAAIEGVALGCIGLACVLAVMLLRRRPRAVLEQAAITSADDFNTSATGGVFWAKRGDQIRGPVSKDEILRLLRGGKITANDLCANSANGPWLPVGRIFRI
jgi:hypothetical protein